MNTITRRDKIQRGHGSADRPVTAELWAKDSQPQTAAMREVGNHDPDHPNVDYKRYHDADYARRELEKIWQKTWLFAMREEEIPEVGDRKPFDVGPMSFFIVRSGPDSFKAFYNSCLHRGTQLCDKAGSGDTIRCPFHAWEWRIDGSLKRIPSWWDFAAVTVANGSLREAKLDRWGGFIFLNCDPDAPPLLEALSVVPEHFKDFRPQDRYIAGHFRKLVSANWKVCQEAFHESYHVVETHSAALAFTGDSQSQYDVWASAHGNVGRQITPSAIPSMHLDEDASPVTAAYATAGFLQQWHYPEFEMPQLDPAGDLRAQLGAWHRRVQSLKYKRTVDAPDAVMLDSTLYFIFPHMAIWLSEAIPFVYQFLPHPSDPEKSYFEVRMMMPYPQGEPRPAPAPMIEVAEDETIMSKAVVPFGFLSMVFDQDMVNMPLIQKGVRSADPRRSHSQLGTYQEMIVQHFNETLDRYMEA